MRREMLGILTVKILLNEGEKEKSQKNRAGNARGRATKRGRAATGENERRPETRSPRREEGNAGGTGTDAGRGAIEGMQTRATRERVIQRLYKMAMGRANDAIKLAYCQEPTMEEIRRLDLGAVSEFRRSNLGSVEVRLIDRVKALQALAEMLSGEDGEAEEFFRAMVQAEEEA